MLCTTQLPQTLTSTFAFLPRVSRATERRLWSLGVMNWAVFRTRDSIPGFSWKSKKRCDFILGLAERALADADMSFFARHMPLSLHWRLFPHFADDALYLDIETLNRGTVTVIGMYFQRELYQNVLGYNLDRDTFLRIFSQAKILVTFNGSRFDWPVLSRYFGLDTLTIPHVDLCPLAHRLGYTSGLKAVERSLGIARKSVDADPVLLFERASLSDNDARDALLLYNAEDTVHLEPLAHRFVAALWSKRAS